MTTLPSLIRYVSLSGLVGYRLGDPLVDRYLEFVAGRARPHTLRAAAHAIRALPAGRLTREHDLWRSGYDIAREFEHQQARLRAMRADDARAHHSHYAAEHVSGHIGPDRDPGPSIGR